MNKKNKNKKIFFNKIKLDIVIIPFYHIDDSENKKIKNDKRGFEFFYFLEKEKNNNFEIYNNMDVILINDYYIIVKLIEEFNNKKDILFDTIDAKFIIFLPRNTINNFDMKLANTLKIK